jgi:hypothetical protein
VLELLPDINRLDYSSEVGYSILEQPEVQILHGLFMAKVRYLGGFSRASRAMIKIGNNTTGGIGNMAVSNDCPKCFYPLRKLEGAQPLKLDNYQMVCPKCHRLFTGHNLDKIGMQAEQERSKVKGGQEK